MRVWVRPRAPPQGLAEGQRVRKEAVRPCALPRPHGRAMGLRGFAKGHGGRGLGSALTACPPSEADGQRLQITLRGPNLCSRPFGGGGFIQSTVRHPPGTHGRAYGYDRRLPKRRKGVGVGVGVHRADIGRIHYLYFLNFHFSFSNSLMDK